MSEDIKFITTELNKVLGRNYNLISFDALSSEDLLQVRLSRYIALRKENVEADL